MQVGAGASVYAGGPQVTESDLAFVQRILSSAGKAWPVQEKQIDTVTALSGSGPAYVFHFMDALIRGAVALGLPESYFADKIDDNFAALNTFHYPPQTEAPQNGQLRAGAHSDFGSLTILSTGDDPGGLQVRDHDGSWQDIAAPPDVFVVNIGDLMAQWTNDRWVSTLHRVVNPPRGRAHLPRQSIAFFHQPHWHTPIECLPGCGTARHPPITSGEHFERKLGLLRGSEAAA